MPAIRQDYRDREQDRRQGSEAQFRSFFESMDQGYILVDVIVDDHDVAVDLLYVEANSAAVRMTGTELVGRRTRELSPDYEPHWFETFGRVARSGVGERHEFFAAPLGVWYDFYVFKVGGAATRRVAAVYQDITVRKQAEATLRESTVRQAFLLALTDAIRPLVDPVAIQGAAARLLGDHLETARAFYLEWHDVEGVCVVHRDYVRDNAASVAGAYRIDDFGPIGQVLRSGRTFQVDDMLDDPEISPEVGSRYWHLAGRAQITVPLLKGGRLVAALTVNQASPRAWTPFDVSLVQETAERTWAAVVRARSEVALRDSEEALRRAHAELEARVQRRTSDLARANAALEGELRERSAAEQQITALFKQLVTIQEEERKRIARNIHDQLGQQMTALRLQLEALLVSTGDTPPVLAEPVGKARQLAEQLDESIDFLTWELRPAALEHLGLSPALDTLVSNWSERFHVAAEYRNIKAGGVRFPSDVEMNLYRLVQEALHNIYKHAEAQRVSVYLERRDGHALLVIEDDGCGFDVDDVHRTADARSLGLVSMRERAALIGAALEIESAAGRGSTVRVRLPLAQAGA